MSLLMKDAMLLHSFYLNPYSQPTSQDIWPSRENSFQESTFLSRHIYKIIDVNLCLDFEPNLGKSKEFTNLGIESTGQAIRTF